jgi:hypothetical protein
VSDTRSQIGGAEFERAYAERSGVTVELLREWGRVVKPCGCGEPECVGWQSVNAEDWAADERHS